MSTRLLAIFLALAAAMAPVVASGDPGKVATISESLGRPQLGSPWPGGNVAAVAVSPDGNFIASLVQQAYWTADKYVSHVWLSNATTGTTVQLTSGPLSASLPRWSPDGHWLAFICDRDKSATPPSSPANPARDDVPRPPTDAVIGTGDYEIVLVRPDGSGTRRLIGPLEDVKDLRWSADGTRLFYLAPRTLTGAAAERGQIYGQYRVIGRDYRQTALWSVKFDVSSNAQTPLKAETLVDDPALNLETFAVSPDATHIAFSASANPLQPDHADDALFLFDLATRAKATQIVSLSGENTSPAFSPDGRQLAFVSTLGRKNAFFVNEHVAVVDVASVALRPVRTATQVRDVSGAFEEVMPPIEWKGQCIYLIGQQPASSHVFCIDQQLRKLRRITQGDHVIVDDVAESDDGRFVAYVAEDPHHVKELYLLSPARRAPRRLTHFADDVAGWKLGTVETLWWRSADGTRIQGVVHKPRDFDPHKKYPLFVLSHGGPGDEQSLPALYPQDFAYPIEAFLAEGVVVLEPNYRGSDGYGGHFRSLDVRNFGAGEMADIMSGVAALERLHYIDSSKLAAMGWSMGGFISAFLDSHTTIFKAISVGAGVTDWTTFYDNTDIPPFTRQYFKATPWSDPGAYQRASPMSSIVHARTPTLIQAGSADERVPPEQSYELFRGLMDQHVETRFILYAGMHHWDPTPKLQLAIEQSNLDWFNHFVLGKPIPAGSPLLGTIER